MPAKKKLIIFNSEVTLNWTNFAKTKYSVGQLLIALLWQIAANVSGKY
jgi:hypothetical protein